MTMPSPPTPHRSGDPSRPTAPSRTDQGAEATTGAASTDFEADLARLTELVEALEEEDLSLDRSLSLYEEGVGVLKRCAAALEHYEKRLEVLHVDQDGLLQKMTLEPVDAEDDDDDPRK